MIDLGTPTYVRLRERMRADIAAGLWGMGRHVTLAEFSQHYGVGTNPTREALLQLQGEGLVEMRMHRGAMVRTVDADFIRNITDIRIAIEAMLVAEAARLATPVEIGAIEAAVEAFEDAAAKGVVDGIVSANRNLHRLINTAAGNPHALDILNGRSTLIDTMRRTLGYKEGRVSAVLIEHRALFEAIKARDPERAVSIVRTHTLSARDDMLERLATRNATEAAA